MPAKKAGYLPGDIFGLDEPLMTEGEIKAEWLLVEVRAVAAAAAAAATAAAWRPRLGALQAAPSLLAARPAAEATRP
jgi:hypothetical protein